ncbi:LysR family transcriptional regulator [Zestomonas carbonaria]|uniref:Hca operon transcriptional activator HcaR n=1 Tax=Zestomonas carbonaria TaxID=2762745 RepID=A0A7U7I8W2_9GAMM|nr:LysR family transcriptional regulator [Pseudomonas carbonaria]CAD5107680.1 Hca operon transcriptional activator HcaR [Pseudomonas carbonaria]
MLTQLRDLDLQLLRLFVTVAESGGFSAAQGELGISQPTISMQMAKLETRLGFRLCERGKSGFRLTPKGEQVLEETQRLFEAIRVFRERAQGVADKLLGELRIGLSESLDADVRLRLADSIRRFRQRNQEVDIELLTAMPADLERQLVQDQLHLAIGYFSGQQSALDYRFLFDEEQALYCGAGHPLFDCREPTHGDLRDLDQVHHPYYFNGNSEPFRSTRSSAFAEQVEDTLTFVLSGLHIGYLPRHIAAEWESRGLLRPLLAAELGFTVEFQLASHRGRQPSEAQLAFTEDLLAAFGA